MLKDVDNDSSTKPWCVSAIIHSNSKPKSTKKKQEAFAKAEQSITCNDSSLT